MMRTLNAAIDSRFSSVKSEIGEHFESAGDVKEKPDARELRHSVVAPAIRGINPEWQQKAPKPRMSSEPGAERAL